MSTSIPPEIRAELDQTPEWWDREFRRLEADTFETPPFDPAEHVGHDIEEISTFSDTLVRRWCAQCPPPPRRPRERTADDQR